MDAVLRFDGAARLRQRLVLSILSGRPCVIDNIRALDEKPGLVDYEVSLLRLLDKLTNGSKIEINYTGTKITFIPGAILGGRVSHDCGTARGIGYFLEAVVVLAPFAKRAFELVLTGITNDEVDPPVDIVRTVTLPLLRKFGVDEAVELKISRRGASPDGGGEVFFQCPPVRALKALRFDTVGKIKRIRGIAYAMRVAPTTAGRLVDSGRAVLNDVLPDVYIYADHYKGADAGNSPGFGLTLVAESTTGALLSADCSARPGELPEDLGQRTAHMLLDEISRGGCVDTQQQHIAALLMTLCPEDVSRIRTGPLSPYTIEYLRDLRSFFGIVFKLTADPASATVILSCVGTGYANANKKLA